MRDEMRIEQITLNNYRQYYGKVVVKFATEENAFSIVVGANGAGKSNLWNAIHWCLFNEEPHLKSTDKPPIINKKYLQEKSDSLLTTYVEIIMVKGRDKYLIRRSLAGLLERLEKDDNGMIKLSKEYPVPTGFLHTESRQVGIVSNFKKRRQMGDEKPEPRFQESGTRAHNTGESVQVFHT